MQHIERLGHDVNASIDSSIKSLDKKISNRGILNNMHKYHHQPGQLKTLRNTFPRKSTNWAPRYRRSLMLSPPSHRYAKSSTAVPKRHGSGTPCSTCRSTPLKKSSTSSISKPSNNLGFPLQSQPGKAQSLVEMLSVKQ